MAAFKDTLTALVRAGDDMTMRQAAVLLAIRSGGAAGAATVRDLAVDIGISKPAVTRAADRLAGLGLLERKEDVRDRRSVLLVLTAAGRKLADRMVAR